MRQSLERERIDAGARTSGSLSKLQQSLLRRYQEHSSRRPVYSNINTPDKQFNILKETNQHNPGKYASTFSAQKNLSVEETGRLHLPQSYRAASDIKANGEKTIVSALRTPTPKKPKGPSAVVSFSTVDNVYYHSSNAGFVAGSNSESKPIYIREQRLDSMSPIPAAQPQSPATPLSPLLSASPAVPAIENASPYTPSYIEPKQFAESEHTSVSEQTQSPAEWMSPVRQRHANSDGLRFTEFDTHRDGASESPDVLYRTQGFSLSTSTLSPDGASVGKPFSASTACQLPGRSLGTNQLSQQALHFSHTILDGSAAENSVLTTRDLTIDTIHAAHTAQGVGAQLMTSKLPADRKEAVGKLGSLGACHLTAFNEQLEQETLRLRSPESSRSVSPSSVSGRKDSRRSGSPEMRIKQQLKRQQVQHKHLHVKYKALHPRQQSLLGIMFAKLSLALRSCRRMQVGSRQSELFIFEILTSMLFVNYV